MSPKNKTLQILAALISTSAVLAACSGGGGGAVNNPGGGGGPTPTPAASPTAALLGTMNVVTAGTDTSNVVYGAAGGATVVFSCGCTTQAGTATATGSGGFTLVQNSQATPVAPNPTYTIVPGRNYIIVAQTAGGAEAWTTQFAGHVPSHNRALNVSNASDAASAAVSLYVFGNSSSSATAFDDWNFNTLALWYLNLNTSPNAQETTLLDDIIKQSVANHTLYPNAPGWDAAHSTNAVIKTDLANVKTSGDPLIPTPCPTSGGGSNCTGAPTP
jgi:hypothetical protein